MVHLSVYNRASFDSIELPDVDLSKLPFPWVDSPFFDTLIKRKPLTPTEESLVRQYRENGYVIIDQNSIEQSLTDRINADMRDGMDRDTGRLQDAWRRSEGVRELACHEAITSVLKLLYEREPIPFQTLNFVRGTEQATHSDAIHFNTLPHGFMAAAWVALEDITIKQGPLHYFPKSHKLKDYDYYDLGIADEQLWPNEQNEGGEVNFRSNKTQIKYRMYELAIERLAKEYGFEHKELTLKRGQFLIWSANLLHGGDPIEEPGSTRRSQVIHYHFDGVIPWTPHFSNPELGLYHVPPLVDIRTNQQIASTYNFMPVQFVPQGVKNRYRIQFSQNGQTQEVSRGGELPYYEELAQVRGEVEGYKKEVERLQNEIKAMTNTRLWKAVQPLRDLRKLAAQFGRG